MLSERGPDSFPSPESFLARYQQGPSGAIPPGCGALLPWLFSVSGTRPSPGETRLGLKGGGSGPPRGDSDRGPDVPEGDGGGGVLRGMRGGSCLLNVSVPREPSGSSGFTLNQPPIRTNQNPPEPCSTPQNPSVPLSTPQNPSEPL